MQRLRLFRFLQPYLYSGLMDDPVLVVQVRPTGRSIMIDCGQLHHLAKRVIRSVDAIFVSHAHMDHFMGFDHFLRHVHVAPRTIAVYGPAGIAARLEHKLAGYDWNLAEENWCDFAACEVHPDRLEQFRFEGSKGFAGEHVASAPRRGTVIYRNSYLQVDAAICDHKLPVLVFRVTERPAFAIDRQRLGDLGLQPGPWLRDLKRRFHSDPWPAGTLNVPRLGRNGRVEEVPFDSRKLYRMVRKTISPACIGYMSDLGFTADNASVVEDLLEGVTLLLSECTFLAEDRQKARASGHLCTSDLNALAARLRPACLVPLHLGKAYLNRTAELYAELAPPSGTRLLELPDYLTPRPLLPAELPSLLDSRGALAGDE